MARGGMGEEEYMLREEQRRGRRPANSFGTQHMRIAASFCGRAPFDFAQGKEALPFHRALRVVVCDGDEFPGLQPNCAIEKWLVARKTLG